MDRFTNCRSSRFPHIRWAATLRRAGKNAGLGYAPVPLICSWTGSQLLVTVRHLGGTLTPVDPFYGWTLAYPEPMLTDAVTRHAPEFTVGRTTAQDFLGAVRIDLSGRRYIALRTDYQMLPERVERRLILGAPTLQDALAVADLLTCAAGDIFNRGRVQVFGSLGPVQNEPVQEEDVILPPKMKADLLTYLDKFWEAADLCARLKISPSRGVLLVGPPGTGKSLLVRHLLTRYKETRQFMFVGNASDGHGDTLFSALIERLNESTEPALVVLEDVDHLVENRRVSMELLLNTLDGLLRPRCPVLWLATTNDPEPLADNLLDRPGRFDRVVTLDRPAAEERRALFLRYSPHPVDESCLEQVVARSAGASPTHIREMCYSAALECAGDARRYSARLGKAGRCAKAARSYGAAGRRSPIRSAVGFASASQ